MSDFCDAEHSNAKDGCYGQPDHKGKHWAYESTVHNQNGAIDNRSGNMIWEWDDEATPVYPPGVPAGSAAVVLNDADLGILLTTLEPVKQFFPDLQARLIEARRRLQK